MEEFGASDPIIVTQYWRWRQEASKLVESPGVAKYPVRVRRECE